MQDRENTLTFTVPPSFDDRTVQDFLRQHCHLSWRMVVKLKRVENGILLNGVHVRTIDRVHAGQTVQVTMPADEVALEPVDMPLSVIFEDGYLLVVNKPPFLAVHPSAGKPEPTLANAVVAYFTAAGTPLHFRPISRLDRNTSGLLPIAKNSHIAFAMAGAIHKTYFAIVKGRLEGAGTIHAPIRIREGSAITREVGEGGKDSITHWESVCADDDISLLRVTLETGRTHQIRVHLSHIGYPLVGDTVYGTDETLPRHALHCARLIFDHPVSGQKTEIAANIPDDMRGLLTRHFGNIEEYIHD